MRTDDADRRRDVIGVLVFKGDPCGRVVVETDGGEARRFAPRRIPLGCGGVVARDTGVAAREEDTLALPDSRGSGGMHGNLRRCELESALGVRV